MEGFNYPENERKAAIMTNIERNVTREIKANLIREGDKSLLKFAFGPGSTHAEDSIIEPPVTRHFYDDTLSDIIRRS